MIRIKSFDEKFVSITDIQGMVFEGRCRYGDAEENEVLYGRSEESLNILNFSFYVSTIKEVRTLRTDDKFFEHFINCYGNTELINVRDGIDSIVDVFESEENEHILRLLLCLGECLDNRFGDGLEYTSELEKALWDLINANQDDRIKSRALSIINKWGTKK